jgi:hypothetical protein
MDELSDAGTQDGWDISLQNTPLPGQGSSGGGLLSRVTEPFSNVLLGAGEAAQATHDINNGISPADALIGAIANGALIYGSGALVSGATDNPIAGIIVSKAMENRLPSNAKMGSAINTFLSPPTPPGLLQYESDQSGGY